MVGIFVEKIDTSLSINEATLENFFINSCEDRLGFTPLARQMRLDSGIVDVFCYERDTRRFFVVELKSEPLRASHLAQVLSYTCELRAKYPHKNIMPLLIGPNLQDTHLANSVSLLCGDHSGPKICFYCLYKFDALTGINFRWFNSNQEMAEMSRAEKCAAAYDRLDAASRWVGARDEY